MILQQSEPRRALSFSTGRTGSKFPFFSHRAKLIRVSVTFDTAYKLVRACLAVADAEPIMPALVTYFM